MATTHIHYESVETNDKGMEISGGGFCITCAIRYVMSDSEHRIRLVSSPYQFNQCSDCEKFIDDTIEI